MAKYKKKPVVIDAKRWEGDEDAMVSWWMEQAKNNPAEPCMWEEDGYLHITTLEGVMKASPGDFIICGVNGEFYPCKPGIFEKTYDAVQSEDGELQLVLKVPNTDFDGIELGLAFLFVEQTQCQYFEDSREIQKRAALNVLNALIDKYQKALGPGSPSIRLSPTSK